MSETIYDLIKKGETEFKKPVEVIEGWQWNFFEHVRRAFLYFNSQFAKENEKRDATPFKNIVRYILNVAFRTEGFNVKDIEIYANDENYYKSFLLRKFHEQWAKDNQIDTFIDELIESAVIYGAALIKNVKGVRPEVVDLASISFADQTNLLDNPFGIKHLLSLDELQTMADFGWGDTANGATISLDMLAELTREEQQKHNGKVEVYEVHGVMPEKWIDEKKQASKKYIRQVQVVAYYKNQDNKEIGVTLFKSKSPKKLFKLLKRDDIKNRALGFGGVEELFDSQVWTNHAMIHKRNFLESASKTLLKTTDSALVNRHPSGLKDLDNLEIVEVMEGKDISQIDTFPRNFQVFNNAVIEWEEHAKKLGSANDPLLGEEAPSGTPFRAQERQVVEGKGIHEYRKEKFARFVEEIYRDWIMPQLVKEITQGTKQLVELNSNDFQTTIEDIVENQANRMRNEQVLNGELPNDAETLKQQFRTEWQKGGNKKFIEILKDEFKDANINVNVVVAGKSKDIGAFTDKLTNVFRTVAQNPQIFQVPGMSKLFNEILENSGLSPVTFSGLSQPIQQPIQQTLPQQITQPPAMVAPAMANQ